MLSRLFKKKIKFVKTNIYGKAPVYATDGSAAFDFFAATSGTVYPNNPLVVDTGIAVEIPKGYCLKIYSRSGQGFNKNIRLANCVGIIDSDYRGSIKIKLTPDAGNSFLSVSVGDRIAQGIIEKCDKWYFEEVNKLNETERSTGGFGSTGND